MHEKLECNAPHFLYLKTSRDYKNTWYKNCFL